MARAGSLIVQMAVDLARFRSDMASAAQISNTRLREIERSAKSASDVLASVGSTLKTGLGLVGIGIGLHEVISLLKETTAAALDYGEAMEHGALKTGLTASEFSKLAEAAKLVNVDVSELSKGLRFMMTIVSKGASGEPAAVKFFETLRLSAKELIKLDVNKQLEVIVGQLVRLDDAADRTRIGVQGFGKGFEAIAPFILRGSEGIKELVKQVEDLGGVMTDEQIKRLAEAEEKVKGLKLQYHFFAMTLVSEVATPLKEVVTWLERMMRLDWTKMAPRAMVAPSGVLGNFVREMKRAKEESDKAKLEEGFAAWASVRNEPAPGPALPKPEIKPEVDQEALRKAAAERARMLKQMQDQYADAVKNVLNTMKELETPDEAITRKFLEQKSVLEGMKEQFGANVINDYIARAAVAADDQLEALKRNKGETAETVRLQREYMQLIEDTRTPVEKWGLEVERLTEILKSSKDTDAFNRGLQKANEQLMEDQKKLGGMTVMAIEAARQIQNAFAEFLFDPFSKGLNGMLKGFVDMVRQMVAQLAAQQMLFSFFSWLGQGQTTGWRGMATQMATTVAGRASGGWLNAGQLAVVGEGGPELFRPATGGTIIPNGAFGGAGMTFQYNIDARGADAERIMAIMPGLLRQTEDRTIARLQDMKGRGRFV